MAIQIVTNNHERPVVYGYELTDKEREDFDYYDWRPDDDGVGANDGYVASFVRYRGQVYDLNDTEGSFPYDRRWYYISDSFFSGVVFRHPTRVGDGPDIDYVICGTYYAS